MNRFPPTGAVQLSPGEDQRLPSEGGWQLLAAGRRQGWEDHTEDLHGEPDRWGFVSWQFSSGGVTKQISP